MFRKLTNDARLPERATKYSAKFDVFANEGAIIGAGETKLVPLGIALDVEMYCFDKVSQLPYDYVLRNNIAGYDDFLKSHCFALHIRSLLRARGLTSLGTGIIDMDYRGEIKMVIHNPLRWGEVPVNDNATVYTKGVQHNASYVIKKGDKIGQLILCRHEGYLLPSEYTKECKQ